MAQQVKVATFGGDPSPTHPTVVVDDGAASGGAMPSGGDGAASGGDLRWVATLGMATRPSMMVTTLLRWW